MHKEVVGKAVVESDGATVWVNSSVCLALFSKMGVDVHKDAEGQLRGEDQCLDCSKGPCGPAEWERFKASVLEHHGVVVSDKHRPNYLSKVAA